MADLQVTQYTGLGLADSSIVQAPSTTGMLVERKAIGGGSVSFTETTLPLIELHAEADCVVSLDGTVAVTGDWRMYAGQTLPFAHPPGIIISVKDQT